MTDAQVVRLEKEGDIGIIIVNYPPVNALGPGVADGIIDCLNTANADPSIAAQLQGRELGEGHVTSEITEALHLGIVLEEITAAAVASPQLCVLCHDQPLPAFTSPAAAPVPYVVPS